MNIGNAITKRDISSENSEISDKVDVKLSIGKEIFSKFICFVCDMNLVWIWKFQTTNSSFYYVEMSELNALIDKN